MIDAADLHAMMDEVSAFGGGPDGSLMRLALSAEDRGARDWLAGFLACEGLDLQIDAIGNMFGRLSWAGPGAPDVMTGSHLDSQPNGGRFDGAYGVVAACAAVKALKRRATETGTIPKANVVLVNWTNEEGARFQPSLLGSSVYTGALALDIALARRDGDGISVAAALAPFAYAAGTPPPVPRAYVELHIEGATRLEDTGHHFGVFTRYWGATKYRLRFTGAQAHTGPTPMAERRDALLAAAYLIAALKDMADRAGPDLHTSVGRLEIAPNSPNVVPGEATCFIELRSVLPAILTTAETALDAAIRAAADRARVTFDVLSVDRRQAGTLDESLARLATETAQALGEPTLRLDTIAGHDAISMAAVCPAILLAVPSVGGIMHHPSEFTSEADRLLGANVLAGLLWHLCTEDDDRLERSGR